MRGRRHGAASTMSPNGYDRFWSHYEKRGVEFAELERELEALKGRVTLLEGEHDLPRGER
jgi:hypothetical protein